jgi:hypothetical protein
MTSLTNKPNPFNHQKAFFFLLFFIVKSNLRMANYIRSSNCSSSLCFYNKLQFTLVFFSPHALIFWVNFFTLIQRHDVKLHWKQIFHSLVCYIINNFLSQCSQHLFIGDNFAENQKRTRQNISTAMSFYDNSRKVVTNRYNVVECIGNGFFSSSPSFNFNGMIDKRQFSSHIKRYFDSKPSSFTLNFALSVLLLLRSRSLRFNLAIRSSFFEDRNQSNQVDYKSHSSSSLCCSAAFCRYIRSPMYKICNFYHHWILN